MLLPEIIGIVDRRLCLDELRAREEQEACQAWRLGAWRRTVARDHVPTIQDSEVQSKTALATDALQADGM
jgi:hypothetical protein